MSERGGIVERLRLASVHGDQAEAIVAMNDAADEIERLRTENWQLKGALGYPVPGHVMEGEFKCGLCEAKAIEIEELRARLAVLEGQWLRLRELLDEPSKAERRRDVLEMMAKGDVRSMLDQWGQELKAEG